MGRVYRPTFVHSHYSHARQNSSAGGGLRNVGGGGGTSGSFMVGAGEAGGVREYSVRFRMVIKVDAGIVKYNSLSVMRAPGCKG